MDFREEAILEQFRSVITIGSASLKGSLLINGGSVIALLAYLGKTGTSLCVLWFVISIFVFCIGISLALTANVLAYVAQLKHLNQLKNNQTGNPAGTPWGYSAVACVVASIITFMLGVGFASYGFLQ